MIMKFIVMLQVTSMDGRTELVSWREKLARLRKLPRPSQSSSPCSCSECSMLGYNGYVNNSNSNIGNNGQNSNSVLHTNGKCTYGSKAHGNNAHNSNNSGSNESPRFQLFSTNQTPRSDYLRWDNPTTYSCTSPVPACLNTFSAFYDPSVSASERFEYYLYEMHNRTHHKPSKGKSSGSKTTEDSQKTTSKSLPSKIPTHAREKNSSR